MICVCGHEQDRHLGGDGLCGSSMGGDGPPMLCQCECFEEGVTPSVRPVYSDPSVRPIPQTTDAVSALFQRPDQSLDDILRSGGLLTEAQSERFMYLTFSVELQRIHRAIEDAIDREVWWMQAMVWTTVFIVPLAITAPAVLWWRSKVRRLQAARERVMAAMARNPNHRSEDGS